ncbi:daptide-type RiPP biosynthesis aminotransferase [Streptomyces sp. AP-93]|uniref:daptide-type RiPP biosynthesis aminotransferase n=1 Tax=Streptomyces sp. AP-93 TaxID=2929048 RepID=UPI001FAEA906|nr:daptide-type RiPP biosynthesis aminotransferase [Streptomyces sp. AP-93]MCJ0871791.1 aminotransferase class III-fold pyridoxal phosphate-dependent enzyme [Streptomyces sp. AP-93]
MTTALPTLTGQDEAPDHGHPALWTSLLPPSAHGDDAICAVSAEGMYVRFADGSELLDGDSGLWNANLGHGNRHIAEACHQALLDASYLSVFRYEHPYARQAAEALVELCGADHFARVLFSTSGGAANDLVMKTARHYHALRGAEKRKIIVGLRGSYHGLTFGGFALTGENLGQQLYGVDQRLVRHVTPNDPADIEKLMRAQGSQIAAVVIEPVLGSGAVPLTDEYLQTLFRLREEHGFLLAADEVATGFGRTGSMFASQLWPERPDLLVTSKGLTNGTCAAAAVIVSRTIADAFREADATLTHGETQAGTPVTCAAIIATIEEMRRLDAVSRGRRAAETLGAHLDRLVAEHPLFDSHDGRGLFRSLRLLTADGEPLPQARVLDLIAAIRAAGAIVHAGVHGIQIMPPLTATDAEIDALMEAVRTGVESFSGGLR